MKLYGRIINPGDLTGEAVVLDVPFSFIGDFDPETGQYAVESHPLFGRQIGGKILVCPTGKGGTIAPFIAYEAQKSGHWPIAILCEKAEPIICECAIVTGIPLLDSFNRSPVKTIKTGDALTIKGAEVSID